MPSLNRTFRVFVSSTFSDLEAERSALQENVFPKLKQLCLEHGCRFQAIDLRWGVRKEAGYDQKTMKICLEEIRRCQKTKLKPNFIVLLGNKYGWQPAPEEIPSEEYRKLRECLSLSECGLIDNWYIEDKNAVPAIFYLKPRTGVYRDNDKWNETEKQLRVTLAKGAKALNLSEHNLAKYVYYLNYHFKKPRVSNGFRLNILCARASLHSYEAPTDFNPKKGYHLQRRMINHSILPCGLNPLGLKTRSVHFYVRWSHFESPQTLAVILDRK
jgi:hypothetical protein